jgi:hypothetical protein
MDSVRFGSARHLRALKSHCNHQLTQGVMLDVWADPNTLLQSYPIRIPRILYPLSCPFLLWLCSSWCIRVRVVGPHAVCQAYHSKGCVTPTILALTSGSSSSTTALLVSFYATPRSVPGTYRSSATRHTFSTMSWRWSPMYGRVMASRLYIVLDLGSGHQPTSGAHVLVYLINMALVWSCQIYPSVSNRAVEAKKI